MTTTNIAGIDFLDEVLAEADAVRERLDILMPEMMELLERLSGVYSAMRLTESRATDWDPSDELTEYVKSHTSLGRLIEHYFAIANRVDHEGTGLWTDE